VEIVHSIRSEDLNRKEQSNQSDWRPGDPSCAPPAWMGAAPRLGKEAGSGEEAELGEGAGVGEGAVLASRGLNRS